MIWRCHDIPCFNFYFLFRINSKRQQLDENDFRQCYGNFFSKESFQKYKVHSKITRHLDNGIWKIPSSWRFYGHGSRLVLNLLFEEHFICTLRTVVFVNDTIELQILFIENMNLLKLVCAIFTLCQNAFCFFFQASEEG